MIYLAGDIHGNLEVYKVVDFFEKECKKRKVSKEDDFLILLGDVGIFWHGDKRDEHVRKILEKLPVTVLWIDGNHENFDLIDALPVSDWHGGKVQCIGSIIHLMRGYVFDIGGKSFFAFGGGFSIDKQYREEDVSWWSREMPSVEEYDRGLSSLAKVSNKVDYVITHTAPRNVVQLLVPKILPWEEELQWYLQQISNNVEYSNWYFGHWHVDITVGKFQGLYDKLVRIE